MNKGGIVPMYKTETHMHTAEVSNCGHLTASEMVEAYHEAGYTTLFVSDHFTPQFLKRKEGMSYPEKIDAFFEGYRIAKVQAQQYGMIVLPSAEICFDGDPNHYLVYGIDTDFFKAYPNMLMESAEAFAAVAEDNGLLLIQAHPFRGESIPVPSVVEGFEIYNSNPRHFVAEDEPKCAALCEKYGLLQTAGSDSHREEDVGKAGVETEQPIRSAEDYINALRSGSFCRIYNGAKSADR